MIGDGLAYVSVIVHEVEAVASILEHDFRLQRTDCTIDPSGNRTPVFSVGATGLALFKAGDEFVGGVERTGVHHLALSVDGLVNAGLEAARLGLPTLSTEPEWGLSGGQRLLLDPKATCGVIIYLSEPLSLPSPDLTEVERIDHIGVASEDNTAALDVFSNRLGWPVESTQTDAEIRNMVESFTSDKYGVVYRTHQPEFVGGLRVGFVTVGDSDLELLQNLNQDSFGAVEHGRSGSTRQDQGAISRYIASRGPSLHHVAFKVQDIDRLLSRLQNSGLTVIDSVGRPGSRRAQIGFLHPASMGGWLVHLVQREELP